MKQGYDALSNEERVVWLILVLQCEVIFGGLDTFYYNTEQASETVWALREIGAHRAADTLANVNKILRREESDHLSLEEQFELWKPISEETWRAWQKELESEQPHDYIALYQDYIAAHSADLPCS
jgi:hypothetical protein